MDNFKYLRLVRPLTRLAENIYERLYEEESKGLDGPSSKRLLPTNSF